MSTRASAGYTSAMGASTQREAPVNGGTVNIIQTKSGNMYVLISPAGALLALTMNLPTGQFNGQTITIAFTNPITLLSFTGLPVIGALTSILANGFSKYVWTADNSTWNRVG